MRVGAPLLTELCRPSAVFIFMHSTNIYYVFPINSVLCSALDTLSNAAEEPRVPEKPSLLGGRWHSGTEGKQCQDPLWSVAGAERSHSKCKKDSAQTCPDNC